MYATFVSNEEDDNIIDAKLQVPIQGFTRVGVADFFYKRNELNVFLTNDERTVYIEYDLKTDRKTVLFKEIVDQNKDEMPITPYHFFNEDERLIYTRLVYRQREDIPKITVDLSQTPFPDDAITAVNRGAIETYNFNHITLAAVLNDTNFKHTIYFSGSPRKARVVLNSESLMVYLYTDVPYIRVTVNRGGYNLLNLGHLTGTTTAIEILNVNGDEWIINYRYGYLLYLRQPMCNILDVRRIILSRYYNIPAVEVRALEKDQYVLKSDPIIYKNNIPNFVELFNDAVASIALKLKKTVILKMKTPKLRFAGNKLIIASQVATSWKFTVPSKLEDLLNLDKKSWYTMNPNAYRVKLREAICIKSDTLVYNEQDVNNELVIAAINTEGWFHPNSIKYVPLSINYVTRVKLYLTDPSNNLLTLNNSQFVIILHFIK